MRRITIRLLALVLAAGACGMGAGTVHAADDPATCPAGHSLVDGSCVMNPVPVTICHRNGNTYDLVATTAEEIVRDGGHGDDVEDAIPPFSYVDAEGAALHYPGLNWDADAEALRSRGCIPDLPDCVSGTHLEGSSCVADAPACPSGFHVEGALCVEGDPVCAEAEHNDGGRCVADAPACPSGTHEDGDGCTADSPTCEAGFVPGSDGSCVADDDDGTGDSDDSDDSAEDTSHDGDVPPDSDGGEAGDGATPTAEGASKAVAQIAASTFALTGAERPVGELPYTGLDSTGTIMALSLLGIALLGIGCALRTRRY